MHDKRLNNVVRHVDMSVMPTVDLAGVACLEDKTSLSSSMPLAEPAFEKSMRRTDQLGTSVKLKTHD